MKYKRLWIISLIFLCDCSNTQKEPKFSQVRSGVFISTPISKFSTCQSPFLNVEIEDQMFLLALDLGFQGDITIVKEVIDCINSKTLIGETEMYGIKGKKYKKKTIPNS